MKAKELYKRAIVILFAFLVVNKKKTKKNQYLVNKP